MNEEALAHCGGGDVAPNLKKILSNTTHEVQNPNYLTTAYFKKFAHNRFRNKLSS